MMIPYDKRDGKIWYNSELVNWSDVKLHVLSHGPVSYTHLTLPTKLTV